jgi:hypothetical protein
MSLEATHIRFAVDLMDRYHAKDLGRYIPGVVYPDSRFFTGIDRALTHPENYRDWVMGEDDFRKGWHTHLLCDDMYLDILRKMLPGLFQGPVRYANPTWINITAVKMLQDMDDLGKFDLSLYLPHLSKAENPGGESSDEIKMYNQIFMDMYANPRQVDLDSYRAMWIRMKIDEKVAHELRSQTETFRSDHGVMSVVPHLYTEMLTRGRALVGQP